MPNSTRQEKLAREWAEHYKDDFPNFTPGTHAAEIVEKAKAAAEFILTHTNPATMADVVWDDEKHFLAEAKTANGLLVAMLRKDQDQWISCIRVGTSPALRTRTEFEGYLTPTGKRYTLTEVQDD